MHARIALLCTAAAVAAPVSPANATPPPRLLGFHITANTICGFPSASPTDTLQARNPAVVLFTLAIDGRPLIIPTAQELSRIRLHASGAGVRIARRPAAALVRRYIEPGLRVRATRAGRVRLWAEVDGTPTNVRTAKVVPPRPRCSGAT